MAGQTDNISRSELWGGDGSPFRISYGKQWMWMFLVSDALTFGGLLTAYGFARHQAPSWPIGEETFNAMPFLGNGFPLLYVALMTFVLIFSSVTMVLAVDAGHHMNKAKVTFYMLLTIIGGAIFVGSQAWEWKNFIKGEYGALETKGGQILQFMDAETGKRVALEAFATTIDSPRDTHLNSNGIWFIGESSLPSYSLEEVAGGFAANESLVIKTEKIDEMGHKVILSREESLLKINEAINVVEGANLIHNEYGNRLFADFFFFITGFHGFHVLSGVVINIIIFFNVIMGTYEKRGHYEMVEKVGLYWHFVDLVWVFVFTFFYLV